MHSLNWLNLIRIANLEDARQRRKENSSPVNRLQKIDRLSEVEFMQHFRLDKSTFRNLCLDIKRLTPLRGTQYYPLEVKVLCTLSFLATGSYQRIVGNMLRIQQKQVSRFITDVVKALTSPNLINKWIDFPQQRSQRNAIKSDFQRSFGLPGVVGCIDCTHIAIVRPPNDEHLYFNRKGYHSLNVQMVCDRNLKILNVNAKFGGATHDSFILSSSKMEGYMRELHQTGEYVWLLGDSGYPQRPWLMTPILNAVAGSREETYTRKHIQARNSVQRCFGLLKSRWRCLLRHRKLHYDPIKAAEITLACCVLHNIAISARLPFPALDVEMSEDDVEVNISNEDNQSDLTQGRAFLNNLLMRL